MGHERERQQYIVDISQASLSSAALAIPRGRGIQRLVVEQLVHAGEAWLAVALRRVPARAGAVLDAACVVKDAHTAGEASFSGCQRQLIRPRFEVEGIVSPNVGKPRVGPAATLWNQSSASQHVLGD